MEFSHANEEFFDAKKDAQRNLLALEESQKPEDRAFFYLNRLEIVASLFVEVTLYLASKEGPVSPSVWQPFHLIETCIDQLEPELAPKSNNLQLRRIWDALCSIIKAIATWTGDPALALHSARIILVCCAVLRRLYNYPMPRPRSEVEGSVLICAQALPFPIEESLPLEDQCLRITENLHWLFQRL